MKVLLLMFLCSTAFASGMASWDTQFEIDKGLLRQIDALEKRVEALEKDSWRMYISTEAAPVRQYWPVPCGSTDCGGEK